MQFFEKSICVFQIVRLQYIIDNIHSLSGKFTGGSFFTADKADNIHCVETDSEQAKPQKQGGTGGNDDRY